MRTWILFGAVCGALALPHVAKSQSLPQAQTPQAATQTTRSTDPNAYDAGPEAQRWELVFGGTGSSTSQDGTGIFSGQAFLGYYLTDRFQLNLRQGGAYSNPTTSGGKWGYSTRVALDFMLSESKTVPFIGANIGTNFGSALRDSWLISPELGFKWWVRPQLFVIALGEYQLTYRSGVGNPFVYTLGIGYNW